MQSINVTSLWDNIDLVGREQAAYSLLQEHCVTDLKRNAASATLGLLGCASWLGPLDPEYDGPAAGVAIVSRRPKPFYRPKALTKDMEVARASGRADRYLLSLFGGVSLSAYNIYGWTMGESSDPARLRTNDLIAACIDEHLLVKGPAVIMGDFNCLVSSLPVLRAAAASGTWFDVADIPSLRTELTLQGTCLAPNAVEHSRRDFIIVNRDALPLVQDFRVITDADYATHRPVSVTFAKPDIPRAICVAVPPKSFHDAYLATHDKQLTKSLIAHHMDEGFIQEQQSLDRFLAAGDTTAYWDLWGATVEKALIHAMDLQDGGYEGHGHLKTKQQPLDSPMPARDDPAGGEETLPRSSAASGALRRLRQLRGFEAALRTAGSPPALAWGPALARRWAAVAGAKQDFFDASFVEAVLHGTAPGPWARAAAQQAVARATAHYAELKVEALKERRAATAQRLGAPGKGATACFRLLRKPPTPPLTFLRGDDGAIRSDPSEVDELARRAWEPVYRGTAALDSEVVQRFTDSYDHLAFRGPVAPLPPIDRRAFHRHVTHGGRSAGGLDNWTPGEWSLLSRRATAAMATLLESIERGASWPASTLTGRAAFAAKTEQPDPDDPLAFRILSVLSLLYRKWAGYRNRSLDAWARTWDHPAIYSGAGARSCEEAWWTTALLVEHCRASGSSYAAGCVDIYNCHDQVVRGLMLHLAQLAGFPPALAAAYRHFHDNIQLRNSIGGSLGLPYSRTRGIPQGCPFSARLCALTLRPWILLCISHGASPRAMQDDLFLMVIILEPQVFQSFVDALESTHAFIAAIGAKLAPDKSANTSNSAAIRAALKTRHWQFAQQTLPVKLHFRDLGAHFSSGAVRVSGTSRARLARASDVAHSIGTLPTTTPIKINLLNSKAQAAALYGSEVTPIVQADVRKFRTAVVNALNGPHHAMRSPPLVLLAHGAPHLDPHARILARRLLLLRRMLRLYPELRPTALEILAHYAAAQRRGSAWRVGDKLPEGRAAGPVDLVLHSLHEAGAWLDDSFTIHYDNDGPARLLTDPVQLIKNRALFAHLAAQVATLAASRQALEGLAGVGEETYTALLPSLSAEDAGLLRVALGGGVWSGEFLFAANKVDAPDCPFCQCQVESLFHMWFECPHVQDLVTANPLFTEGLLAALPKALTTYGLAPPLPSDPFGALWGGDVDAMQPSAARQLARAPAPEWLLHAWRELRERHPEASTAPHLAALLRDPGAWAPPPPVRATGRAPTHPNVFTDGSVRCQGPYAVGGGATWEPAAPGPATQEELDWLEVRASQHGLATLGYLASPLQSSTRAELLAIIYALLKGKPLCIASDSSVAINRVAFLQALHPDARPRKLTSMKNSDLLDIIATFLDVRPRHSLTFVKVKSHIDTEEAQRRGHGPSVHAGNIMADQLADEAVDLLPAPALPLLAAMRRRSSQAQALVKAVQAHMLAVLKRRMKKEDRDLFTARNLSSKASAKALELPAYANPVQAEAVALLHAGLPFASGTHWSLEEQVARYVRGFRVTATPRHAGVSWLELLVHFQIKQGVDIETLLDAKAHGRTQRLAKAPTLTDRLRLFQSVFRRVAAASWRDAAALLRPAKQGCGRLAPLGFHTCLACTSMLPAWPCPQQRTVAAALLALRGGKRLTLHDLDRGDKVPPAALSLFRPSAELASLLEPERARAPPASALVPARPFQVRCPRQCGRVITLPGKPVQQARGWPKALCGSCQAQVRLGRAICVACDRAMPACNCPEGQPQAAGRPALRSASIFSLLRGQGPSAGH